MKGTQPRRPWPLKRASVAGAVLTYGLLLSYCAALYVLVLAIGGVRDGHAGRTWLYVVATVAVVATVEPVRRWLRRNVEEVVYDPRYLRSDFIRGLPILGEHKIDLRMFLGPRIDLAGPCRQLIPLRLRIVEHQRFFLSAELNRKQCDHNYRLNEVTTTHGKSQLGDVLETICSLQPDNPAHGARGRDGDP